MRVAVNVLPAEAAWGGASLSRQLVVELGRTLQADAVESDPVDRTEPYRRELQGAVAWVEAAGASEDPGSAPGDPGEDGTTARPRITVAHLAN